jgi:putative membrane protein
MDSIRDFTMPSRLHVVGLVIAFGRSLWRFLRQGLFLIILLLARRPDISSIGLIGLAVLGCLVLVFIFAYLRHRHYTYHVNLENREFVVDSGVFNKSKTVVKFANIIQVNINQNFLQKILSIYSVTLNTAGSDKVEVDLYALDEGSALALREFLMQQIKSGSVLPDDGTIMPVAKEVLPEMQLLKVPSKNILLISLFSNYRQGLALFFAFCVSMYQNIQDLFEALDWRDDYEVNVENWRTWGSMLLFAVIFIMFIPFIINIFRYYFKYFDFSIFRNNEGNFSMRYGMINTKDVIFNNKRVQTVSFRQNKLLKRFDLGYLAIRQIITDRTKAQDSAIEIPGVNSSDRAIVYNLIFEEDIYTDTRILRPKIGLFVSRTIKMLVVLSFLLLLGLGVLSGHENAMFIIYFVLAGLMAMYNFLYYRNYRFYVGKNFLIKERAYGMKKKRSCRSIMRKS